MDTEGWLRAMGLTQSQVRLIKKDFREKCEFHVLGRVYFSKDNFLNR